MLKHLILLALSTWIAAPLALADGHGSGHADRQMGAPGTCCLSVEGDTAQVLVAPSADAVRRVQAELALRGFNPGPIDGIMGARTDRALRTFQRDEGLLEGLLTVETLSRLGIRVQQTHMGIAGHRRGELAGGHAQHTASCCHASVHPHTRTVTRRVIRHHPAERPAVRPAPQAEAELLPNYVSATTTHRVEALSWYGKPSR